MAYLENTLPAVDSREKYLEELKGMLVRAQAEARAAQEAANTLRKAIENMGGESEEAADYSKMELISAIVSYLESTPGRPVNIKNELTPALIRGGARTKKDNKPLSKSAKCAFRIVGNTIFKNRDKYGLIYDPEQRPPEVRTVAIPESPSRS